MFKLAIVMPIPIMTAIRVLLAVFPADVLAVDPMMPARHVAWDPDHFIVVGPVTGAMGVKWLVANLD